MLLTHFLEIVADWRPVFPQQRSFQRAVRQALGSLVCLGRRCLTRILWTWGGQQRSWSAEYFLHSRCQWDPQALFAPILRRALPHCRGRLIGVAIDDTRLRKTGRSIPQAFYQRDPLSPPFHVNLLLGLRFLQASLLLPLHRRQASCRALPIRFAEVSRVKKPSAKVRQSQPEAWRQYRQAAQQHNLSQYFVEMGRQLRQDLDAAGGANKILVLAGDGSFCNRTCLRAPRERTELILRGRKDAVRCCACEPRPVPAASTTRGSSPPSKCVRTRRVPARPPRFSMAVKPARCATKNSGRSIGGAVPDRSLCG
jgi:hypothetical protein